MKEKIEVDLQEKEFKTYSCILWMRWKDDDAYQLVTQHSHHWEGEVFIGSSRNS